MGSPDENPLGDPAKYCKSVVLKTMGVADVLWASASTIALSRSIDEGVQSPGFLLRAAETYSQALSYIPAVGVYRYARYGTIDTGSFESRTLTTDLNKMETIRDELYRQMCDNAFVFMAKGPGQFKAYIDGEVKKVEGYRTAINQHFDAIDKVNTEVAKQIGILMRRTFTVKVACEATMVMCGAGPIALGVQIGIGLSYALLTNVINDWTGFSQADVIALQRLKGGQAGEDTSTAEVLAANASGVAANVAQEQVDMTAKKWRFMADAEQRAVVRQQKVLAEQAEEFIKKAGSKSKLTGAEKVAYKQAVKAAEATAQQAKYAGSLTRFNAALGRYGIRAVGVGVGLYFMRKDLGTAATFVKEGDWNPF